MAPEAQGFGDAEAKNCSAHAIFTSWMSTTWTSKGNTRRSYGRVYYVEKKAADLLRFDLRDKQHNRAAAGFQAWVIASLRTAGRKAWLIRCGRRVR